MLELPNELIFMIPDKKFRLSKNEFGSFVVQTLLGEKLRIRKFNQSDFEVLLDDYKEIGEPPDLINFLNKYGVMFYSEDKGALNYEFEDMPVDPVINDAKLLKYLITLVALAKAKKRKELSKYIKWDLSNAMYFYNDNWLLIPDNEPEENAQVHSKINNYRLAVYKILYHHIDKKLKHAIDIRLNPNVMSFKLQYWPNSTQSLVWLHFADSLSLGVSYGLCQICGKQFRIGNKPGPKPQVCSDKCRVRKFRRKPK